MRFLGIDYGSVRVGLALSDEMGIFATPLETTERAKSLDRICAVIAEKGVNEVILGMPRNMDGSYGSKAEEARKFGEALATRIPLKIRHWDERLTTLGVERLMAQAGVKRERRKQIVDQLAAQQILQSYLDSRSVGTE